MATPEEQQILDRFNARHLPKDSEFKILQRFQQRNEPVGYGEAFARGIADTATLGLASKVYEFIRQPEGGRPQQVLGQGGRWEAATTAAQERLQLAREQQPLATITGEVAGAVLPGAFVAAPAAPAARVLLGGVQGAAQGLIEGGPAEVAQGGALGTGIAVAAEALPYSVGKIASRLNKFAGEQALKAAGFMKKDTSKLQGTRGGKQLLYKYGGTAKFGREQLIDRGLVQAGDTLDSIYEKAVNLTSVGAGEMKELISSVDTIAKSMAEKVSKLDIPTAEKEAFTKALSAEFQGNTEKIAARIESEYIAPKLEGISAAFFPGEVKEAQDLVARIRDIGKKEGAISLQDLQKLKTTFEQKKAFRTAASNLTLSQELNQEVARVLRTEVEDLVGKLDDLEAGMKRLQDLDLKGNGTAARGEEARRASGKKAGKKPGVTEIPLGQIAENAKPPETGLATLLRPEAGPLSRLAIPAASEAAPEAASEAKRIADVYSKFKEAKTKFQVGKLTSEAAQDRMAARTSNRTLGLSSNIAGAAGMAGSLATGSGAATAAAKGIVLAGLNSLAMRYGSAVTGVGAAKLADLLERKPQWAIKLASNGSGAANVLGVHYALMQSDKEYAQEIGKVDINKLAQLIEQSQKKD